MIPREFDAIESPDWRQLHFDSTVVDLHAHPSLKVSLFKRILTQRVRASQAFDPLSMRTDIPKLQQGGVDVLLSTIYAPEKGIYRECPYLRILRYLMPLTWNKVFSRRYFDLTLAMMDEMELQVQKAADPATGRPLAQIVKTVQELDALLAQDQARPLAVIHSLEGAHSLEGNLENLDRFFNRGVAYLTLAHFYVNKAVYPCFPYPESVQKLGCFQGERNVALGLTGFGEQVVEKMLDLGMIVDVTHCTPPARRRIYDIVGQRMPVIASHVGAYELNPNPYNLKDWELRRIADSGGVVGVIFMNYWLAPQALKRGVDLIARTVNHCVDVAGIEHVAIGTDFDGFTDPPDDLPDASRLPRLTQRLIAEGYRPLEIAQVLGGNALRVLRQGWGRKA